MVLPCVMAPQIILYGMEEKGENCYLSITTGGENDDDQLDSRRSRGTKISSKQEAERREEMNEEERNEGRKPGLFIAKTEDGNRRKSYCQSPLGGS